MVKREATVTGVNKISGASAVPTVDSIGSENVLFQHPFHETIGSLALTCNHTTSIKQVATYFSKFAVPHLIDCTKDARQYSQRAEGSLLLL